MNKLVSAILKDNMHAGTYLIFDFGSTAPDILSPGVPQLRSHWFFINMYRVLGITTALDRPSSVMPDGICVRRMISAPRCHLRFTLVNKMCKILTKKPR
jgi:hypothetical protein